MARLIREQNDLTLAELCERVAAARGVHVSVPTMHRAERGERVLGSAPQNDGPNVTL